jgi:predicted dinucleotide-binding enzyme
LKELTMTCSIIGSRTVGGALVRRFARSGIAVGIANTRGPESIETMAKQLVAQVTAMTSQDGLSTDVIILAVPLRAHTAVGDELSDSIGEIVIDAMNTDDISPDELMGLLNAAR